MNSTPSKALALHFELHFVDLFNTGRDLAFPLTQAAVLTSPGRQRSY